MSRVSMTPVALAAELADWLAGAERVAVLSVGSELRGDDAAGPMVAAALAGAKPPRLEIFEGGTAPENATGFVSKYGPSHLIVVDAVESENPPGSIELIRADAIGGVTFSTHMLPLALVVSYLLERCPGCQALVIGVVPRSTAFGFDRSPEVARASAQIAAALVSALGAG